MLMRSARVEFGVTSWRSQLSKSMSLPACAGSVTQERLARAAVFARGGAAMKRSMRGSSNLRPGAPRGIAT